MLDICPFCGKRLDRPVSNGITSCQHCLRVFDDCSYYRMLTASWYCRTGRIEDAVFAQDQYELDDEQVKMIQKLVIEGGCSADEFYHSTKSQKAA